MKYSKIAFYSSYVYHKLRIPLDVKKGRRSVLYAESIWLANNVLKTNLEIPSKMKTNYIETRFGKFYLTPDVVSLITVSPAFERRDTDYLESIIDKNLREKKSVLFIDIGAYFGDYSVRVGNRFKKNKKLMIYAFEPGTEYLSLPTLTQLRKNVKINKLKNVKIFSYGIGSRKGKNEIGIEIKTLDQALNKNDHLKYDLVIIKLDIDDFVIDGLMGIESASKKFKKVILLVEDFVKPRKAVAYLKAHNYKFVKKLTPYNSFWIKENV